MEKNYKAYDIPDSEYELYHHGIKGMKWGVRRFQNEDGTLTDEGRKRLRKNSSYGKVARKTIGDIAKAGIAGIATPAAYATVLAANGNAAGTAFLSSVGTAVNAGKIAASVGMKLSGIGKASVAALKGSMLLSGQAALLPVLSTIGAVSAGVVLAKGAYNLAKNIKTTRQNREILDDDAEGRVRDEAYYNRHSNRR
jgi:hypothetical protein